MEVKKTITLILKDRVYQPVVNKNQDCPLEVDVTEDEGEVDVTQAEVDVTEPEGEVDVTEVDVTEPEGEVDVTEVDVAEGASIKENKRKRKRQTEPEQQPQVVTHPEGASIQNKKRKTNPEVIVISDSDPEPNEVMPVTSNKELTSDPDDQIEDTLLQQVVNLENLLIKQEKEAGEAEDLPDIKFEPKFESRKIAFPMEEFKDMVSEVVCEIPYNVNGTRYYLIDVPEEDMFLQKYRDGRYFQLHTSKRKGFNGMRRVGKCRGNFQCTNTTCSYFLEEGKQNKHQFTTLGKK